MTADRYIDRVRIFNATEAQVRYALTALDGHEPGWRDRPAEAPAGLRAEMLAYADRLTLASPDVIRAWADRLPDRAAPVGLRLVIEGHRGTVTIEPNPDGAEVTAECAAEAASVLLGYRPSRFRLANKSSGVVLQPDEPPRNGTWLLVEVGGEV